MRRSIQIIEFGDIYPLSLYKIQLFGYSTKTFNVIFPELNFENNSILDNYDLVLMNNDFIDFQYTIVNSGFTVIIVNRPLENGFFSRIIHENLIVISIFGIDSLNIHEGISYEMFINRLLLAYVGMFKVHLKIDRNTLDLMQINSTGCLYDYSIYKPDIAKFFRKPIISSKARKIFNESKHKDFIQLLEKAIKKLEIGSFYKIKDWLKENPMKGLIFTFLISFIFSGLLGNFIYDLIKWYFNIF